MKIMDAIAIPVHKIITEVNLRSRKIKTVALFVELSHHYSQPF